MGGKNPKYKTYYRKQYRVACGGGEFFLNINPLSTSTLPLTSKIIWH
jgi:hypothetical protein